MKSLANYFERFGLNPANDREPRKKSVAGD